MPSALFNDKVALLQHRVDKVCAVCRVNRIVITCWRSARDGLIIVSEVKK